MSGDIVFIFEHEIAERHSRESKSLSFVAVDNKCKTKELNVVKDGMTIGSICWCLELCRYSFYPNSDTVYDETCLRDIAKVLDDLNIFLLHYSQR